MTNRKVWTHSLALLKKYFPLQKMKFKEIGNQIRAWLVMQLLYVENVKSFKTIHNVPHCIDDRKGYHINHIKSHNV